MIEKNLTEEELTEMCEDTLRSLKELQLVNEQNKLSDNGAELLDRLNLYNSSFSSRKIDFTDQATAFDALFEDL